MAIILMAEKMMHRKTIKNGLILSVVVFIFFGFSSFVFASNYGQGIYGSNIYSTATEEGTTTYSSSPSTPPVIPPPAQPPVLPPIQPLVPPIIPLKEEPPTPTPPPAEPLSPPVTEENTPTNETPGEIPAGANNESPNTNNAGGGGNITFTEAKVMIGQVSEAVVESFIKVTNITKEVKVRVSKIIETPAGDITSKVVTTTGAVAGASISIATVLFANPLSFSELFLIPFRLWTLLLVAFGIKKRNVPWGTVYDSVTKQPLDPAYVVLQDLNGNEVATSITDLDGRYGFLVPPGQYRLIVNKTNYGFPSKKLSGKVQDELYHDLYFNEIIDISEGGVISKNIPMDPLKFDWNEFAKKDQNLMKFFNKRDIWIARASNILFYLGSIITIVAVIVSPAFYNIAILVIYVLLFILKRTILKPRAFGYIRQKETQNPLSFAILRIFFAGNGNEVIHKVADKTGRYYCLIPNGTYYAKIENKNPDESYSLVNTSNPIEVKNGYINKKFEV